MSKMKKLIKDKLKGYTVTFGDEYVNVARKDGIHCEFYGDLNDNGSYLTATYTIDNKVKELDYWFSLQDETELNDFVADVIKILED